MKDQIFKKYKDLLIIVSMYSDSRDGKQINLEDIFVALLDLFSYNNQISNFLFSFKIDITKILNSFEDIYNVDNIDFRDMSGVDFTITKETLDLLVDLDDIRQNDLFTLNLFLELLYNKTIIKYISKIDSIDFLEDLNVKLLVDNVYKDKKLKKEFSNVLNLDNYISSGDKKIDVERIVSSVDEYSDFDYDEETSEETVVTQDKKKNNKLFIDTFGINLIEKAKKGNLEPVVGRKKEIDQVIYTLLRKTKSNPLLIGEAGVGKTAIIEGLTQSIVSGEVPTKLKNKKIYSLDMGTLVAGTKFRGEFEQRLKNIVDECLIPENNIILFIDEIHTVIGAGNQEGGADTANMIKPYLARGEITLIGATTFDEYKKHIEKDPALTRRFQIVNVQEPSTKDSIELLDGIKYRFEDFHGVNITKEAIERAVNLSKRYILDKYLPDKAIDLIDEACSRKSSKVVSKDKGKKIDKLNKEIEKLENKMKKSVEEQDYFTAADYKESITEKKDKIYKLQTSNDTPDHLRENILAEDIDKVISVKYGVSISILSKSEIDFLKDLKNKLNKEIIGQQDAVGKVVDSIVRNKFSPLEKTNPIGTFLFLGASGVGKSYLARLLADDYFQDNKALIKINMSEYSQSMSANQLTGSAAGYVGYEEGGILTEAVRKKPYSVVLFDEIEKGSPQVLNILLQILDNGYLEDNKGRKIDFKNTIIILTSNLGAEYFNKEVSKVGFMPTNKKNKEKTITDEKKDMIMKEVKNVLPIELINRFDDIVYFNTIDTKLLSDIFDKYYKNYRYLWKKKKGVNIPNITKLKKEEIIKQIHKKGSGVRGIEKYLYNELENKVIEKLLK